MTLLPGYAIARPVALAALLLAGPAAIPWASAQDPASQASGPPPVPAREYGGAASGAAADFGVDTTGGRTDAAGAGTETADQAQPLGPPSAPTRVYLETAGFGAPAAPALGEAQLGEGAGTSADQLTPADAAVDAPAPDGPETSATASSDPLIEEQSVPAAEVAEVPAARSEAVEALAEDPAGEADTGPDDIVAALIEDVPEQRAEGAEMFSAPLDEALDALPEETLAEDTPAVEVEQTEVASADVAGPETPEASAEGGAAAAGSGRIVYAVFDNTLLETRLFRLRAGEGETPEDVSGALDALGAAQDNWIASAPDGAWLLLGTQRFDDACAGWPCLAVVPADLSSGEAVRTSADVVRPEGLAAIASGGGLIVYPSSGGPHDMDLWAITRQGEIWSDPLLLTADSPYAYNDTPALSPDGGRVAFDCGDQPNGMEGTAICEAATDGSAFRVVLTPQDAPQGIEPGGAHHRPAYAPDGSIVFQARWTDGLWRVADGSAPEPVGTFAGEASPCVLPDGRIASLWIGRSGSGGVSELKVMTPDGASYVMLLTELQIEDIGCGG